METIIALVEHSIRQTLVSLTHNWPYLLASVLVASALKAFLKSESVSALLFRFRRAGVLAATAAAVATPFCSCGTTAVVLGMMASTMPLAPVVAFMIASPLSSPGEFFYSAGLFGWPFAIWFFAVSILLGLAGGAIAAVLEGRGWLKGQTRFKQEAREDTAPNAFCACESRAPATVCGCAAEASAPAPVYRHLGGSRSPLAAYAVSAGSLPAGRGGGSTAACLCAAVPAPARTLSPLAAKTLDFLRAAAGVSRTLVPMFLGFAFLGYLLNGLIPASWIQALFGEGRAYSVPLAATIGLPLYVSSEASLPLVRALLDSGMTQGAVMAFLIAGSGTSVGAITGALTIARWKVVGLVVVVLWAGAILAGWGFDLLAAAGLA